MLLIRFRSLISRIYASAKESNILDICSYTTILINRKKKVYRQRWTVRTYRELVLEICLYNFIGKNSFYHILLLNCQGFFQIFSLILALPFTICSPLPLTPGFQLLQRKSLRQLLVMYQVYEQDQMRTQTCMHKWCCKKCFYRNWFQFLYYNYFRWCLVPPPGHLYTGKVCSQITEWNSIHLNDHYKSI